MVFLTKEVLGSVSIEERNRRLYTPEAVFSPPRILGLSLGCPDDTDAVLGAETNY